MIQNGPFNIQVWEDLIVDDKTKIPYHLTNIEKFDENDKCIAKRNLYINGALTDVKSYFKDSTAGEIDELYNNTRNNERLRITRSYVVAKLP